MNSAKYYDISSKPWLPLEEVSDLAKAKHTFYTNIEIVKET